MNSNARAAVDDIQANARSGRYLTVVNVDTGVRDPTPAGSGHGDEDRKGWIPVRIRLADYPLLKQLAWQLQGTDALTPSEALSIYERNWRHLDLQAMEAHERNLVEALRLALGQAPRHV